MEQIIRRIKKLKAHAESAKELGSVSEASAFAAKVSDLLAEHHLSASDIDFAAYESEDITEEAIRSSDFGVGGERKATIWVVRLTNVIARGHGCYVYYFPGSPKIMVVGRESDRRVTMYLVETLVSKLDMISKEALKDAKQSGDFLPRYWRKSWLDGAISGIDTQLKKAAKAREVENAGNATALVRLNTGVNDSRDWANKNLDLTKSRPRTVSRDRGAFDGGKKVGSQISLAANGVDRGSSRFSLGGVR
jgi:hypothetical protein